MMMINLGPSQILIVRTNGISLINQAFKQSSINQLIINQLLNQLFN